MSETFETPTASTWGPTADGVVWVVDYSEGGAVLVDAGEDCWDISAHSAQLLCEGIATLERRAVGLDMAPADGVEIATVRTEGVVKFRTLAVAAMEVTDIDAQRAVEAIAIAVRSDVIDHYVDEHAPGEVDGL